MEDSLSKRESGRFAMRHAIRLSKHNPVKLDLTWNVLDNSKFEENQKKLQLQKLFQITPYFFINFLGIFITT
jgi:hypothetical protein